MFSRAAPIKFYNIHYQSVWQIKTCQMSIKVAQSTINHPI